MLRGTDRMDSWFLLQIKHTLAMHFTFQKNCIESFAILKVLWNSGAGKNLRLRLAFVVKQQLWRAELGLKELPPASPTCTRDRGQNDFLKSTWARKPDATVGGLKLRVRTSPSLGAKPRTGRPGQCSAVIMYTLSAWVWECYFPRS